jgi:hypothetical protein
LGKTGFTSRLEINSGLHSHFGLQIQQWFGPWRWRCATGDHSIAIPFVGGYLCDGADPTVSLIFAMFSTSPFRTSQQHAELRDSTQGEEDSVDNLLATLSIPPSLSDSFKKMVTNMDMFTVFNKSDCLKFIDDLSQVDKSNPILKDCNNHRFLLAQLDMCVRFRAHGGSFQGHPSHGAFYRSGCFSFDAWHGYSYFGWRPSEGTSTH